MEDDDILMVQSYTSKELSDKRFEEAKKKGEVIYISDSDDEEKPVEIPRSPPYYSLPINALPTMTKTQLKQQCRIHGLKVSGRRNELIDRLTKCIESPMLSLAELIVPNHESKDSESVTAALQARIFGNPLTLDSHLDPLTEPPRIVPSLSIPSTNMVTPAQPLSSLNSTASKPKTVRLHNGVSSTARKASALQHKRQLPQPLPFTHPKQSQLHTTPPRKRQQLTAQHSFSETQSSSSSVHLNLGLVPPPLQIPRLPDIFTVSSAQSQRNSPSGPIHADPRNPLPLFSSSTIAHSSLPPQPYMNFLGPSPSTL